MKNLKKISFFLTSIFVFGCSDEFIDLNAVDSASVQEFYKTNADFEAAINGVYSNWRGATVGRPMETEYRADNFTYTLYTYYEFAENDLTPNAGSGFWNLFQTLVYPSNVILDKLEQAEEVYSSVADQIKGEALFFRG